MDNHKTIFRLNCTVIVHILFTQYDSLTQGFEISDLYGSIFVVFCQRREFFLLWEEKVWTLWTDLLKNLASTSGGCLF